ncbi:MAG: hypothetical protein R3C46_14295 [Hyphomonadaceae bacterium]
MTKLALAGIDAGADGALVFRFTAAGQPMTWEFKSASFPEFLALLFSGRLGSGNDVHFDAAEVSMLDHAGCRSGSVRIAIGDKATIVAPLPAQAIVLKAARHPGE